MIGFIKELKGLGIIVKIIRLDNAGENNAFVKKAKSMGLGLKFEFTPTRSPQFNGKVERWFATMFGRVRAILNQGRINSVLQRAKFAGELMQTVTKVDNVLIKNKGEKSSYEKFWNKKAPYAKNLRIPLEIGVVSNLKNKRAKLENRGEKMIFMGYAEDHDGDVFRFWNPKTRRIIISRDVRWTNVIVNHTKPINSRKLVLKSLSTIEEESSDFTEESDKESEDDNVDENSDSEEEDIDHPEPTIEETEETVGDFDNDHESDEDEEMNLEGSDTEKADQTKVGQERPVTVGGSEEKVERAVTRSLAYEQRPREVKNLDIDMNYVAAAQSLPKPKRMKMDPVNELTWLKPKIKCEDMVSESSSKTPIPRNYKDIMNMKHCDKVRWLEAVEQEFTSMDERKVWTPIKLTRVPPKKKLFGTKWVFEEKDDGRLRARLVALGYAAGIPGLDYQDSFAPVVNDVTWRLMLMVYLSKCNNFEIDQIDIKTAFLYGDLDEPLFMYPPEGYSVPQGTVLMLNKAIYGLVIASRQWYIKWANYLMNKCGFNRSWIEPCLFW